MGGGKGGASSPDYTALAQADQVAATQQYQLGQQQLQWGQQQFNDVWPYAQQYMQQETASSAATTQEAQAQQQYYDKTYQPIESQFADTAKNYNSPAQANANAGAAEADVSNTFNANRQASLSNLESYGIDPSQTRFGALDLSTRISQAASTAAAGTQSRLNTQNTGLALEGEAINTGKGYANNVAQSYATAQNAGSSGIGTANSTVNTGVNSMGSPTSYYSSGNQAMGNAGQMTAAQGNFNLQNQQMMNQASSNTSSGIGQIIGGGLGLAAMFM